MVCGTQPSRSHRRVAVNPPLGHLALKHFRIFFPKCFGQTNDPTDRPDLTSVCCVRCGHPCLRLARKDVHARPDWMETG